jgi:integrase/recombinase XerD
MIFIKYYPSTRDRCYYAMTRDMSGHSREILNLKIHKIVFEKAKDGKQYTEDQ